MRVIEPGPVKRGPARGYAVLIGAMVCAGLTGGVVTPAWAAAPPEGGAGDVQLGSFALGALEATIGELDGSFGFALPVGGLRLAWDSRAAGTDPMPLGGGWSFGLTTVRVQGGIWVFPASGGAFEMDEHSATGLAGYPRTDVRFLAAEPGAVVPARADGTVGETPYEYVLHELGGVSTYFDATGYPLARIVLDGDRLDWQWEAGGTGRLLAAISADGSVTTLDWSDLSRVEIQPGSNVSEPIDGAAVGRWVVELEGGRVTAVADPVGGVTRVAYRDQALVRQVTTPSGGSTVVDWQASPDAVARVDRVRSVDAVTGEELSVRQWSAQGQASPSGWPFAERAAAAGSEVSLSDGKTRVTSSVDGWRRMSERRVVVTSNSGERVLQGQAFEYPDQDDAPGVPVEGVRPTTVTTTHHDRNGSTRSTVESYAYDELGRMTSRTTTDGATLRREYDGDVTEARPLPIGLVTEETTTARDGLVSSTRSALSEDRTAVVALEQWSGRPGEELTRTSRVEREVDQGFVTEERAFPGGRLDEAPVVTRWSKLVDPASGTKTVEETVAAGTAIEASTSVRSSLVHGGAVTESDALGNRTVARFDAAGRQIEVQDAAGRTVSRVHRTQQLDGVNAVTVTDHTGVSVTERRDALGRVVTTSDNIAPTGRAVDGYERLSETREYDEPGVERVTDAWGATTTTERDVYGRTTRVTLPNRLVQVAEFDDVAGTATSGVSVSGSLADAELTSTTVFDDAGRATETTGRRADGVEVRATVAEYDGLGREVRSSDGRRNTATDYDAFGHAVESRVSASGEEAGEVAGAGVTAERRYDPAGVSVEKTLRSGTESYAGQRRELDALGRVVAQTDQRGATERITYTLDGLVAEVASDTGRVTTSTYDATTRALVETKTSSPRGSTVTTAFRYDEAGRVTAVFDPADEAGTLIRYESDDFGNITRTRYPDGTEIGHEFDEHGRATATVDAAGNRTAFDYDEAGVLVAAVQTDADDAPIGSVRYAHDEFGRVSSLDRENGVRTEYAFTSASEVRAEVTTGPDGLHSEREYVYSPDGTLTIRIDRTREAAGHLRTVTTDYEYDLLDRLVSSTVREGDGPDGRVLTRSEYRSTLGGDLASETVTTDPGTAEAVSTTRRFEYSELGELIAIVTGDTRRSQVFDVDGSMLESAEGGRYEYDAAARLISQTTPDGVHIQTSYWADGTRRAHTTATGSTRFYWDGARLVNERHDAAGAESGTASYLIGTARHARSIRPDDGAARTSYYGTDRHGNVTDLTDHAGAVTTTYAYSDYGVVTVTGDETALPAGIGELGYNPFQYSGEYTYRDGTQPLGPRTYDPVQARFLTKDEAPLSNLYAYVDLNPITNIDPTGRMSEEDQRRLGLLIGGLVATAVGAALLVWTGGIGFTVAGAVGGLTTLGDVVASALEVTTEITKVEYIHRDIIDVVSWTAFAVGLGFLGAGAGAKAASVSAAQGTKTAGEVTTVGHVVKTGEDVVEMTPADKFVELNRLRSSARQHDKILAKVKREELIDFATNYGDDTVSKSILEGVSAIAEARGVASRAKIVSHVFPDQLDAALQLAVVNEKGVVTRLGSAHKLLSEVKTTVGKQSMPEELREQANIVFDTLEQLEAAVPSLKAHGSLKSAF